MSEVVVVGGGPAGAAAAWALARGGRCVTVLERKAEPTHSICGEFVGGDGLDRLAALGIDVRRLDAQPIGRVRLVRGRRTVEAALPFRAAGVSRLALDEALLDGAARAGAVVLRGRTVRALRGAEGTLDVGRAGSLRPNTVFLATGKHELRGARRQAEDQADAKVGFKTHLRLTRSQARALQGAVELMLFRDAYAGLQMVTSETANLCLVVAEARLARVGGWDGLLDDLGRACPLLAQRLDGARLWPKPLAIARVPYGYVHRPSPDQACGPFRLGDQMGVIPSFTGDGIAIALRTAQLAAGTLLAGGTAADYHRRAARSIGSPIRLATALYRGGHSGPAQLAMMSLARLWPGALRLAASLTRAG